MCDIVYVDSLSADTMVSRMNESEFESDFSPSDTDSQTSASSPLKSIHHYHDSQQSLRTLFESGVVINAAIKAQQSMECRWPPTSDDLNVRSCETVIPVELYNMLAWIVGASDECTIVDRVTVPQKTHLLLLSICQDIVYMSSNGRNQTPKSLALGLAVRHLTGSGQVMQLLNKFGHCASPDVVRGLETSLAELQLLSVDAIPQGFQKGKLTIFVWDNIDFAEEAITGAGTTHHTNGIMIQNNTDDVPNATKEITGTRIKKGQRTLKPALSEIEPYHQKKKCGPQNISDTDLPIDIYKDKVKQAVMTDLAYVVIKVTQNEGCTIPGWRGFNMNCKSSVPAKSSIYYMPVIEASPTEMSTVNKILQKSLEVADNMELNNVVLVFDQAIYAKAQQIRWSNDLYMSRIVVRLGEFHTCMSYLGVLGKRFKEAGLQDILIEAEVVAQGSINGVITGHHYNRSIKAHKLMYEALERLRLKAFFDSISEEQVAEHFLPFTEEMVDAYYAKKMDEAIKSSQFSKLMDSYSSFILTQSRESDSFQFWSSYINMVQLLLTFIRATRESNWTLHLASVRLMMPWFFAYGRMNYSRYLPAYWLEMMNLPSTHYDCYLEMSEQGNWTVRRQDRYPFSSIACDQAIEQTVNRDSKTKGGVTGFTLNSGAVQRWILAQPQRSAITRQCEMMAGVSPETRPCKDNDATRIKKDEKAITLIMDTINSMINPFDNQYDELVCLSSGVIADRSVSLDLKNAYAKGANYMKEINF
ncbi:uncharacterized protein LOC121375875 [Gigantopelta aegis]|uniref:uncharacterized protein LOC121375875 n=1 Tax=Gigantopelta aegis TaxID=1735272 RepID=UPI001B88940A|nr:uncharacterized protein LOC121375875 [Gigantopelta aegis]